MNETKADKISKQSVDSNDAHYLTSEVYHENYDKIFKKDKQYGSDRKTEKSV